MVSDDGAMETISIKPFIDYECTYQGCQGSSTMNVITNTTTTTIPTLLKQQSSEKITPLPKKQKPQSVHVVQNDDDILASRRERGRFEGSNWGGIQIPIHCMVNTVGVLVIS